MLFILELFLIFQTLATINPLLPRCPQLYLLLFFHRFILFFISFDLFVNWALLFPFLLQDFFYFMFFSLECHFFCPRIRLLNFYSFMTFSPFFYPRRIISLVCIRLTFYFLIILLLSCFLRSVRVVLLQFYAIYWPLTVLVQNIFYGLRLVLLHYLAIFKRSPVKTNCFKYFIFWLLTSSVITHTPNTETFWHFFPATLYILYTNECVCVSFFTDILRKGMNSLLPPTTDKY